MGNTHFNQKKSAVRVQKVICKELTDWQQTVIRSFYFDGKTVIQIARESGRHRSSVYRALHRGEARLRRFLAYYA